MTHQLRGSSFLYIRIGVLIHCANFSCISFSRNILAQTKCSINLCVSEEYTYIKYTLFQLENIHCMADIFNTHKWVKHQHNPIWATFLNFYFCYNPELNYISNGIIRSDNVLLLPQIKPVFLCLWQI